MADTVTTLRPDAAGSTFSGWTLGGGAGSAQSALSDDNDATYVQVNQVGEATFTLNFGTFALPARAIIHQLVIRVRGKVTAGGTTDALDVSIGKLNPGFFDRGIGTLHLTTVLQTLSLPGVSNYLITQADIDNLTVAIDKPYTPTGAVTAQLMELYADVSYNQAPTISSIVVSPVDTSRPTVAWVYADPESDAQERYRIKMFSSAVYTAGGFDPETAPAAWDSGEVFTNLATATVGTDLQNGVTYRAYGKVADVGSAGRYSAWNNSTAVTIVLDPPAVPVVTAVADDPNGRVVLSVQGRDNLLTTNQASLETSAAGWQAQAGGNCAVSRSTAQFLNGVASLAMTSSAGGTMIAETLRGVSGVPAASGMTVTAMAFFWAATAARSVHLQILSFTAGGVLLDTDSGPTVVDSTSGWPQATVSGTLPPATAFASVVAVVAGTGAGGEVHNVDDISLAPGFSPQWTRGGLVPTQEITVQRSADGGATWKQLTRLAPVAPATLTATGTLLLPQPSQTGIFYDYEAPPGPVSYRAWTYANASGAVISPLSDVATVTTTITNARLKDLHNPALNQNVCIVNPPLTSTSSEPQQAFTGLGDPYWSVSSDVSKGEVGDLTFAFDDDADFAAFEALRRPPRTLLLQTGYGDNRSEQFYVRLGQDRTVTRLPAKADGLQARIVTVGYRQVQEPA